MKTYRGNGGIVLLIHNLILDVDGVCLVSHLGRFATGQIRGNKPRYPYSRLLGGHQNQFGRLEEDSFFLLPGIDPRIAQFFSLAKIIPILAPLLGGHGGRNPCISGFTDSVITCYGSYISAPRNLHCNGVSENSSVTLGVKSVRLAHNRRGMVGVPRNDCGLEKLARRILCAAFGTWL